MSTDLPPIPPIQPTPATPGEDQPVVDAGIGLMLAMCLLVVLGAVVIFVVSG